MGTRSPVVVQRGNRLIHIAADLRIQRFHRLPGSSSWMAVPSSISSIQRYPAVGIMMGYNFGNSLVELSGRLDKPVSR